MQPSEIPYLFLLHCDIVRSAFDKRSCPVVAKKKSRNGRKTASNASSNRDSGRAKPRVAPKAAPRATRAPAAPELSPPLPEAAVPLFPRIAAGLTAEDVDALARSSVALADGVQSFGRALIEMQRQSASAGLSAARALVDARNLQDVIEVQRRFVIGSVESAVRETGGLARLASRLASEAWAPLLPRLGAPRERD
jgi:Phasin protein